MAGRDINLKASGTSADNVTLVAQRDVNLSTVHETSQEKITWDGDNRAEVNRDNAIGSTVQGKNIGITAGRDINSQAAYVNADGALSAIGLLAGGVSGALGAAASSALMPDLAEQIKTLGLPPAVESAVSLAAAAAIGTAVGGGAGAAGAYNVDLNNRQARPAEIEKIKQLADGDPKKEARLQAAACALFRCWQEFAPGTPEYANAKSMGDWGSSAYVTAEYKQLELARSLGLFDYSAPDLALDLGKLAKNTVIQLAQDFKQVATQIATHGPNALPPDLPPRDPWDTSGPSGTAAAVVTPPVVACTPNGGCVVTPPVAMPGHVYASTGNSSDSSQNGGESTEGKDEANSATVERPTPRSSEIDVGTDIGPNYTPQVSYLKGKQVPYGTAGSVRPDYVGADGSLSFEVKNYNIQTNTSGLIKNVSQQAIQRAENLPTGMVQHVVIDVRGQTVTDSQKIQIIQGIVQKSNGIISPTSIRFKQ